MQKGLEVIFITPQSRRHKGRLVSDLIVEQAKTLGIKRVTKRIDAEGMGEKGHLHSWHFFEQADQPMELMFVVEESLGQQLIDGVSQAGIHAFCVARPVEFGELNG